MKLCLRDKNGIELSKDDVLYNGKDYYRIGENHFGEFEMLSCTKGYIHNVQPKDLKAFERVGTFKALEHLFICD